MPEKNNLQNNLKLQQTVRFFETLLRASADSIVITDPADTIIFVNDTFCKIVSSNRQDVIETNLFLWLEKLNPNARNIWKGLDSQIKEQGIAKDVEFASKTGEETRYFSVNSSLLEKIDIEETGLIISIWHDITERKMAQEALQRAHDGLEVRVSERTTQLTEANISLSESKQFIETIINLSPDILYIYDLIERKNVYSNNGIQKILSYSVKEVQEMGDKLLSILMHPDDFKIYLEETYPRYSKLKDKQSIIHEYRMKNKNGQWQWLDCKEIIYSRQKDGVPKQIFGVVHDITQRKLAEEMLKLHEIRLNDMLELHKLAGTTEKKIFNFTLEASLRAIQSDFAFIGLMTENEAVMINHAWSKKVMSDCKISEKPVEYSIAQSGLWGEIVRQRRPIIVNDYETSKEFKKGYPQGHVPIKRLLGIPIFKGSRIVVVACAANKHSDYTESDVSALTSLIHEMWDIFEQKRKDEDISKNRAMLLKAQEIGHVGSWEWDIITNDLVWTKEIYSIYGLDPRKVKPKYELVLSIMSPESKTEFLKAIDDALKLKKPFEMEYSLIRPDGTRSYAHTKGEVLFDSEGRPLKMFGMVQDITQRKVAEAQHVQLIEGEHEARAEADAVRKLDRMKSMFIAATSHELRTPLNSIIGFTSLAIDGTFGELNPDQKKHLMLVHSSGKHLLSLINDILDLSMIESGNIVALVCEFNLRQIVDEAATNLNVILNEKNLRLKVDVGDIIMKSDRMRMLQCLINLISNAVKYTEKGSIGITAKVIGKNVEISITDTGIGIQEEDIPKLFGPFVRLQSPLTFKTSGTGLGLYLVKKLARDFLSGDVEVESEYGRGSKFTLRVPVEREVKS